MSQFGIVLTLLLASNIVLDRFLGFDLIVEGRLDLGKAVRVGLVMSGVIPVTTVATWIVYTWILLPLGLWFLQTLLYVLILYGVTWSLRYAFERLAPALYALVEGDLRVIGTNSAVLGVSLIVARQGYTIAEGVVAGIAGGLGFLLVIVIVSTIIEQIETESVPHSFRGKPILFVTLGLVAMAFLAFDHAFLQNLLR